MSDKLYKATQNQKIITGEQEWMRSDLLSEEMWGVKDHTRFLMVVEGRTKTPAMLTLCYEISYMFWWTNKK